MIPAVELSELLEKWSEEGRDVQLFNLHGMSIFPIYDAVGCLRAYSAVFPIKRGAGDRCPPYEGSFPCEDGAIIELGRGWRVMCVTVNPFMPIAAIETKLEAAAKRLKEEGEK